MRTKLTPVSIKETNIEAIKRGDFIVNLGEVLEIDELKTMYSIVIFRSNQKQVFSFDKNDKLLVRKNN